MSGVNFQVPEFIQGLSPSVAGYGSVALIAVTCLIVWRVARRIVQLGYFLLYFFLGFAVVYAASAYTTRSLQVPLSIPIIGGLTFSAVASAIRAKLMRIVGAVMMVALFSLVGKTWTQYTKQEATPSNAEKAQAAKALLTAKKEWEDLAPFLPKKGDGTIKPGFVSAEELQKLGVEADFQKVVRNRAWHTWLTGLYNEEQEDLAIWTPGGSVQQAKKGLQLKAKK